MLLKQVMNQQRKEQKRFGREQQKKNLIISGLEEVNDEDKQLLQNKVPKRKQK